MMPNLSPGLCLVFLFSLFVFSGPAALALERLPEHVHLKNHEQSFTYENDYALKDGKIWIKPNELTTGKRGPWVLFEGTGVPYGLRAKSFGADDRVASFQVEGLFVVAVSESDRVYFWQPTEYKQTVWQDSSGAPLADGLYLPPHRDWTFSLSLKEAPWKRNAPMHDIDWYYEDTAGNKVEFGFTATLFSLDPNGQVIRYWDTGLPTSFHKAFVTPERGRFVAERIGASGSTIFVTDKSGKMYTRMYDYEMNGACPGLLFCYDKVQRPDHTRDNLDDDRILYSTERTLPLEDWKEQPAIPLAGEAARTNNISIHMTGEGNAARELRVQGKGRDRAGQFGYGYYFKPVLPLDAPWEFKITQESYDEAAHNLSPTTPHELGRAMDKTYSGKLSQAFARELKVELVDFHYFDTPATLRVTLPGGKAFDLILHTFDAWSPNVQQKRFPELIGSAYGEAKLLIGTLEIPQELLDSKDPEIKPVIDHYFRALHHVHGAFSVTASDTEVTVNARLVQRKSKAYEDYYFRNPIRMRFSRSLTPEEEALTLEGGFTAIANAAALERTEGESIESTIARNRAALTEIRKINRQRKLEQLKAGLFAGTASAIFYPVKAVLSLLGVPKFNALWGSLIIEGGVLFNRYAVHNLKMAFRTDGDYQRAVRTMEERIEGYSGSLKTGIPYVGTGVSRCERLLRSR